MDVRRWVVALLVLPALAGCSDDPSSDAKEPPTSASHSPSESETPDEPVEPELPDAATTPTKAGAAAFLKYYWAAVEYAERTGETAGLTSLALPGCQRCVGGQRFLERMARRGGRIIGASFHHRDQGAARLPRGVAICTMQAKIEIPASREFYGKDSTLNKRWPGGSSEYQFLLRRSEDGSSWQVAQWRDAP